MIYVHHLRGGFVTIERYPSVEFMASLRRVCMRLVSFFCQHEGSMEWRLSSWLAGDGIAGRCYSFYSGFTGAGGRIVRRCILCL